MKPVEPVRLAVKGTRVEADPRSFDAVRKGACISMTGTTQDDIALSSRLQGQRRAKRTLPKSRCLAKIRQRNRRGHAASGDQKMIALQLNGARSRAKWVHEKSEQWSLLQPNQ